MRSKVVPSFLFIFLGLSSVIFAYSVFGEVDFSNSTLSSLFYSAGKLAGLIGFLFLAVLIISGDTARFFDKYVGMDMIIKFQRKFAIITTLFVLLHPIFFIISNKFYISYLIPRVAYIPLFFGTISLYLYLIVITSSAIYKRISHQAWQVLHIVTYVLFFSALYHASNIGSDTSSLFVKSLFILLFIGIIIGGFYRTNYKIKHRKFKCLVDSVDWETHDTFTLKLKPNKKLNFKAGQFCFLRLNKDRLFARHPFSLSSSPDDDTLDFTIKLAGRFTKIASKLKKGEEVMVDGPFGVFTSEDDEDDLVFIAGGVGITPFMSMIRYYSGFDKKKNITLFYGCREKKDIIFKDKLDKIKGSWLKRFYTLSREKNLPKDCVKGYVDKDLIIKNVKNLKDSTFYICGPELMKDKIVKTLLHLGVDRSNIKFESFFW